MALGVARLCASGLQAVPPATRWGLLVATLVGLGLGTAEALAPERAKRWVPSPIGLGLSFLLPASMSLALFIGALASAVFERLQPEAAKRYTVPISSGLIAGESVVAVLLAIWATTAIAR